MNEQIPSRDPRAAPQPRASAPRRRLGRVLGLTAAAGLLIAGLAGCAQPGHGPGGWHRHGHRTMDPAVMAQRIDRGVERMLSAVDATPEQKQKASAIAKQAAADLAPMRERMRNARQRGLEILSAANVDRAALEKLRADELQSAELASRRVTQALADVAEVLNPEQRAKLRERIQQRMGARAS